MQSIMCALDDGLGTTSTTALQTKSKKRSLAFRSTVLCGLGWEGKDSKKKLINENYHRSCNAAGSRFC